jgi:hypothetical protein
MPVPEWPHHLPEKTMLKPIVKQKMNVPTPEGGKKLRTYYSAQRGTKMASVRIKCGCCSEQTVIYYDHDLLEINGVVASLEEWKRVLGPLLFPDAATSPQLENKNNVLQADSARDR